MINKAPSLIRLGGVLGPLELHLQSLRADLEAVHGLDGGLRRGTVVERNEPEALGQVRLLVDEHLGGDNVAKG